MNEKKTFLLQEFPALIAELREDTTPNFGLMSAQRMVEHLAMVIKSSVKRYGEPENPPTERQLGFKRFIEKGAVMKHRPSTKTKADLSPLKYETYPEAVSQIPVAIERFYHHFEAQPDFISYSPFWGELSFEELEHLHFMHTRYHLWQFGKLEVYP